MKKSLIALSALLLLAGCNKTEPLQRTDIQAYYEGNPLAREQVAANATRVMVGMLVNERESLRQNDLFDEVDALRLEWGKKEEEAMKDRKNGLLGSFIPVSQEAFGRILVRPAEGIIFTSTAFSVDPGPQLRLFATKSVDPRGKEFPDADSVDLGVVPFPYGPQTFRFRPNLWQEGMLTLVLYDTKLERMYGFAQLSPQL